MIRFSILFAFLMACSLRTEAQKSKRYDSLATSLGLTKEQKESVSAADVAYLKDMNGIRERAETGYNPPKDIQYQHMFCLVRRWQALREVLNDEQYTAYRKSSFDIYAEKEWMASFYRKHKLPTIEKRVEEKEKQLAPSNRESP